MGLAQNLKNLRNRRPKVAASPFPSKPYSSTNKKAIFDKSKNIFIWSFICKGARFFDSDSDWFDDEIFFAPP